MSSMADQPVLDVRRLRLLPDDTVVIVCKEHLSDQECDRLAELVKPHFPNNQVLVLDHPLDIAVVSPDAARDAADRAWVVLDWLAENNPAALELCPYKARR